MEKEKYILNVQNATKIFGGLKANEDISFHVNYGEIVGMVGPNGAGKTTLFNSLSGAHKLTYGKIIFEGTDITKMEPHNVSKLGIGRTFQIPQSLNNMTVFENVLVGALGKAKNMKEAREKSMEVIELCGLSKHQNEITGKMGVIQKKRIEIARALATVPKLLLLDETMAGLTNTERVEAVELIRKINKMNIAIITIEHVMDVIMTVSDRVVVINAGRLLMEGTPQEVTSNEEVISAYLGGAHSA
ncbi:ABC transporter ATP-binding protein [Lacrimispora sp.]|uniref:ABC transporter ATP-binding protein n=1 Tax=Lacrimispora sp. TaxID=2719234 RepID=UPI002FDAE85D